MPDPITTSPDFQFSVPFANVATFLKHFLHDVRNELNSVNLEATLLGILVTDAEAAESVQRIQDTLHQSASRMASLSAKLSEPSPSFDTVPASFLLSGWKDDWQTGPNGVSMKWHPSRVDAMVRVDVVHLNDVLRELTANLRKHGTLDAEACLEGDGDHVCYRLTEAKTAPVTPERWGALPFEFARKGSQGLGLWRARRLVAKNHGEWTQRYDAGARTLVTEVTLPVAGGK